MSWFILCLTALACFRLTRLITDDKISEWLRRKIVKEAPAVLKQKAKEGIECAFCVSLYVALVLTCGLVLVGEVPGNFRAFVFGAAVWGLSILLNQVFVALTASAE